MARHDTRGRLTTHVLDTASGRPAAGLRIALFSADAQAAIVDVLTDEDGRCKVPLLEGAAMKAGRYEIRFHVGAHFRATATECFYDIVPVPFVISDETAHYHVPLLVAPFAYSTYRGS